MCVFLHCNDTVAVLNNHYVNVIVKTKKRNSLLYNYGTQSSTHFYIILSAVRAIAEYNICAHQTTTTYVQKNLQMNNQQQQRA